MKYKKILISIMLSIVLLRSCCSMATEQHVEENLDNIQSTEDSIDNINDNINNEENNNELKIYSESAILIESKTGKILYEKNIHDKKYPASTTKVLTAIIAIERCDLNEKQIASAEAIESLKGGYTKADIQVGEEFTIEELLNVMMLQSANEAACIIAEHISKSVPEFAKLMNEKAKEIGCIESNFVNPNGMHDENHYSSAYDLALIARYAMKNEIFRNLVITKECSLPHTDYWGEEQLEGHEERIFKNTNQLLIQDSKYYYPYANGVKAGFTTPAKNCLIASSNKNGFEVISVVLHAESTEDNLSARYVDTINLFEYGYNNYKLEQILDEYKDSEDILNNTDTNPNNNESNSLHNGEKVIEDMNIMFEDESRTISLGIIEIIIGFSIIIIITIVYIIRKIKNRKE